MRKRIHFQLVMIAALAIVMTGILATLTFYEIFKEEVFENLQTYTHVLENSEMFSTEEIRAYHPENSELRITVIDKNGQVLMDSDADVEGMKNHLDRPEVEEAFLDGEGRAIRRSETLETSTFYYAARMDNGNVLRVAKEAGSIFSLFEGAMPLLLGVAIFLSLFCAILAHFLTQSFVAPVEQMAQNLDNTESIATYKELTPFLNTIREQHDSIVKNARMRQDFTANVSHELKTPLTSISGYAELIETGMASEKDVQRFSHEIHKNANRLLSLINDILQLSELDSSDKNIEKEQLNLFQMAYTCVEMLKINAEKQKVTIKLTGDQAFILGNRGMIEEVLYNLCDNAIRYNKENGFVDVSVANTDEGAVFEVDDTGLGIAQEHQERIFERFYRVDKSRSKERGGTGLGLAIVKHILVIHDAKVWLDSEPGKGTTIRVLFPKIGEE